ncbi:YozQ family protein [Paenibacillus ginsengarvi]|uniref:DUF4025 domain-containing protein n=1 Tax=Paenibacillus ginsengarvi TaxID=400777 RepID=A0A3B0CL08_9BACL|nr:YozQ family protein [Paenibacillus ginsengarvi]RKN85027.1 DUF4025 domain-containing protein [Paenibacillus ginsengarvi]
MTDEAKKSLNEHAAEVATHHFNVSDYESSSETAQGIAITHEQLNDMYAIGTSDDTTGNERETEMGRR